jgi:hypothetical protein
MESPIFRFSQLRNQRVERTETHFMARYKTWIILFRLNSFLKEVSTYIETIKNTLKTVSNICRNHVAALHGGCID